MLTLFPLSQNPDVAKAKLISRMAKMGQPMLPFLAGTTPAQLDSSDSEIEVGFFERLSGMRLLLTLLLRLES